MAALPRARTANVQPLSPTTKHEWVYNSLGIHRWQCSAPDLVAFAKLMMTQLLS
jgi:hypothetical protein